MVKICSGKRQGGQMMSKNKRGGSATVQLCVNRKRNKEYIILRTKEKEIICWWRRASSATKLPTDPALCAAQKEI